MVAERRKIQWTTNLAYAVGLITTDGSLSKDQRHIDFTSNDIDLIRTLKKCLKLKNKIGKKMNSSARKLSSFRVQFGDVILYRWLLKIGLMPKKSKRLRSLVVPDKFFFDFLRGHLDGDGSGVHSLTFSKNDSIVLSKLLYYSADVPRLERKFLLVKDFLNIRPRW